MRNFIKTAWLGITVVLLGAGCSSSTNTTQKLPAPQFPETYTTYTSTDGWTIKYPADWTPDDSSYATGGLVTFLAPQASSSLRTSFGVTRTSINFDPNLIKYDDLKKTIEQGLSTNGAANISTSIVTLPAGKAVRGDSDLTTAGFTLKTSQTQIYKPGVSYSLNFLVPAEDYKTYVKHLELMMLGFDPGM